MTAKLIRSFLKTSSGRRAVTLLARHGDSAQEMFTCVHACVQEAIPQLQTDHKYTTKDFMGDARWGNWFRAHKFSAGMCLAYMVRVSAVALELHKTSSGKGTKHYRKAKGVAPQLPVCLIA
jgi:hypothetical protein